MLDQIQATTMPKAAAAQALKEYRENLHGRAQAVDRLAMKAYRELAKGRRIINLLEAFRVTGLDEKNQPRLAIARADWSKVFAEKRYGQGRYALCFSSSNRYWSESVGTVKLGTADTGFQDMHSRTLTAGVPIIPPKFRPEDQLSRYHILFEAAWEQLPPVDPFLIKLLKWPMFVVLAEWDLTPVERMIFTINANRRSRDGLQDAAAILRKHHGR